MTVHAGAVAWAETQVTPCATIRALMARLFRGPTGRATAPAVRRSALSFMRWQAQRGVLDAPVPGSVWWGRAGQPSSHAVRLWLEFSVGPTGRNGYRAHNASIVDGYLEHRGLAEAGREPERFLALQPRLRLALRAAARLARPGPAARGPRAREGHGRTLIRRDQRST